jgi:hypothetical protein
MVMGWPLTARVGTIDDVRKAIAVARYLGSRAGIDTTYAVRLDDRHPVDLNKNRWIVHEKTLWIQLDTRDAKPYYELLEYLLLLYAPHGLDAPWSTNSSWKLGLEDDFTDPHIMMSPREHIEAQSWLENELRRHSADMRPFATMLAAIRDYEASLPQI